MKITRVLAVCCLVLFAFVRDLAALSQTNINKDPSRGLWTYFERLAGPVKQVEIEIDYDMNNPVRLNRQTRREKLYRLLYDRDGALSERTDFNRSCVAGPSVKMTMRYGREGRLAEVRTTLENGILLYTEELFYNEKGELAQCFTYSASGSLLEYSLYDENGRVISVCKLFMIEGEAQFLRWDYYRNDVGDVTLEIANSSIIPTQIVKRHYEYDFAGNWIKCYEYHSEEQPTEEQAIRLPSTRLNVVYRLIDYY